MRPLQTQHRGLHTGQGNLVTRCVLSRAVTLFHEFTIFAYAQEYNLKNLRTIHRLDRLTSGLLMFGRNPAKAREMETQIRTRQVRKEYVARVEGEFPM